MGSLHTKDPSNQKHRKMKNNKAAITLDGINYVPISNVRHLGGDEYIVTITPKKEPEPQHKPKVSPFLKWVGGKRKLLSQYADHLPDTFNRYHEPFLGGGSLFFYLDPTEAVLTDINEELINAYKCVRDDVDRLIDMLAIHQENHMKADRPKQYYEGVRDWEPCNEGLRAARFIYLNKTCFNGLYRVNKKGKFNVPMGSYKNPLICVPEVLRQASLNLQGKEIGCGSFLDVEIRAAEGDLVFLDPPYHPISKTSNFTTYDKSGFGTQEQHQLKELIDRLTERGVKVMTSNSNCEFIRELYQGYHIHEIKVSRSVSSKASSRKSITELLITNY